MVRKDMLRSDWVRIRRKRQILRDLAREGRAGKISLLEILEITGYDTAKAEITTHTLYAFEETGEDARGRILGSLEKKDELICRGKLARAGLERSGHA